VRNRLSRTFHAKGLFGIKDLLHEINQFLPTIHNENRGNGMVAGWDRFGSYGNFSG